VKVEEREANSGEHGGPGGGGGNHTNMVRGTTVP
jgi:hypothetical protein